MDDLRTWTLKTESIPKTDTSIEALYQDYADYRLISGHGVVFDAQTFLNPSDYLRRLRVKLLRGSVMEKRKKRRSVRSIYQITRCFMILWSIE